LKKNRDERMTLGVEGAQEVMMAKEHISAGSKVAPGVYRCNACANRYECAAEGEELPMCPVCDSVSWRTLQLSKEESEKKNERA